MRMKTRWGPLLFMHEQKPVCIGIAYDFARAPPAEAEDMCIDSASAATVTLVLAYSARTVTPRLYGNLSDFHSDTAASS